MFSDYVTSLRRQKFAKRRLFQAPGVHEVDFHYHIGFRQRGSPHQNAWLHRSAGAALPRNHDAGVLIQQIKRESVFGFLCASSAFLCATSAFLRDSAVKRFFDYFYR
jgi:hypothetical protein